MGYRLKYDLHTHTIYSQGKFFPHAKGSILDNAKIAESKGLSMLGISDHGPGHSLFALNMEKLSAIRTEIEIAKQECKNLDIKLAVEANITSLSGELDVKDCSLFDYLMAGYHYGAMGDKPCAFLWNAISKKTFLTDIVINTLYKNDIKVLTHPGDKGSFDIDAIAKACEETNTLMEINNKHNGLSVKALEIAAKYNVQFVIGSDAHTPADVGACDNAIKRIETVGLPLERVVNLWSL